MAKLKKENPHIKTIVSVGGGASSKEFPKLAQSPAARKTFARKAREFCDQYKFDGVDSECLNPHPFV